MSTSLSTPLNVIYQPAQMEAQRQAEAEIQERHLAYQLANFGRPGVPAIGLSVIYAPTAVVGDYAGRSPRPGGAGDVRQRGGR